MSTTLRATVLVSGLIIFGMLTYVLTAPNTDTVDTKQAPTNGTAPEIRADLDQFSLEQVQSHASSDDCWTVIDGFVYDLTSYIPRHPGGKEILRACGTDGSTLFNERETENGEQVGSGTSHSSNAQSQLERLLVGQLQ